MVVTCSETDSVKFNDASAYRNTIFLRLKTDTLYILERALEGNQTSSGTK